MKKFNVLRRGLFFALCLCLSLAISPLQAQDQDPTKQYFEISKNLEIMTNVFTVLNKSYVNPIEPGKMTKKGLNAMLSDLDPYTNFFTEADAENFKIKSIGAYGGIGLSARKQDSLIVVSSVFEGSPADKAGIKPGDIIDKVNGQSMSGKSMDELEMYLQGAEGDKVNLTMQHPINLTKKELTIVRSKIQLSSVPHAELIGNQKNIAYVYLAQFLGNSAREVRLALDSLKKQQPQLKGVVLDLRNNPGGLLHEAVKICNLFLPIGQTVVTTKGKEASWERTYKTSEEPWDTEIPVVVLVNSHSASASEVVSGTLQDLDRAVIIGAQSFGKGLVQQVVPIGYNTSLKVTVAHYYTPSGRCIQALDYAHRNEDGSVSKIPENQQKSFKTSQGRIVKEGGGIIPDIKVTQENPAPIVQTLSNKNFLFNYATKYYYEHKEIAPARSFKLTESDFTDLLNWLKQQSFYEQTKAGELLNDFKKEAQKNGDFARVENTYAELEKQMANANNQVISDNKTIILNWLSSEIAGRYYYSRGATLNKLSQDDLTIRKATEVLEDAKGYQKILR